MRSHPSASAARMFCSHPVVRARLRLLANRRRRVIAAVKLRGGRRRKTPRRSPPRRPCPARPPRPAYAASPRRTVPTRRIESREARRFAPGDSAGATPSRRAAARRSSRSRRRTRSRDPTRPLVERVPKRPKGSRRRPTRLRGRPASHLLLLLLLFLLLRRRSRRRPRRSSPTSLPPRSPPGTRGKPPTGSRGSRRDSFGSRTSPRGDTRTARRTPPPGPSGRTNAPFEAPPRVPRRRSRQSRTPASART
mmetsp:Transcript_4709/g.21467  ORF Transcript_4709/g.21467 Transcript_4709/m.21467 type:complete len:250 (+) Transcript_4709:5380-6129(+)